MCICCVLNARYARVISSQTSAHVFDEVAGRRRLADILFSSHKLYFLARAVVLQVPYINTLYANMSRVGGQLSSRVDIGLLVTFMTKLKTVHYGDPRRKSSQRKIGPGCPVWCVDVITNAFLT